MFVLRVSDDVEMRECSPTHAAELFSLVEANRQYLRRWLPWLDQTTRLQHVEQFLRESRRRSDAGNGQTFVIVCAGRLAGVVGQHYVDRIDRKTELGYWLDEGHQGRGIMTRSVDRMIEHVFDDLDLNRVMLSCALQNVRSRAIADRLGFAMEGVLRQAQWLYTEFVDLAVYGLLRKEWRERKKVENF